MSIGYVKRDNLQNMIQTLDPGHLSARFSLVDVLPVVGLPHVGHLACLKVTSWSMFPTLLKGDVINIGPADQVLPGDIVVFRQTGALVCHRVTGFGAGGEVYTKGDQADAPDAPLLRRDILAKVTAVTRGGQPVSLAPVRNPPIASLIRMEADLLLAGVREHLLSLALRAVTCLKQVPWVRGAAAAVLGRLVHYSVGIRAPIRSIDAYRFMSLGRLHRSRRTLLPAECRTTNDLIFMASLGGHPLAMFDPVSGELRIRRVAAGLGLEERLRRWNQMLGDEAHSRNR
jgi:signal peptidase I